MMNKEVKALWTAALRSGKYEQGRSFLCTADSDGERRYCCLGVLCALAVIAGAAEEEEVTDGGVIPYDENTEVLPPGVTVWAGLSTDNPFVVTHPEGLPESLAALNDDGLTFARMADLIDEQL